jgi:hypothetical protein
MLCCTAKLRYYIYQVILRKAAYRPEFRLRIARDEKSES